MQPLRRTAALLVVVLALAACTGNPQAGPSQQLLATWGTTLAATMATVQTINHAAAIACSSGELKREQCQKIDLAGEAAEALIHQAGEALEAAHQGRPADPAMIFAELAGKALELVNASREMGLVW